MDEMIGVADGAEEKVEGRVVLTGFEPLDGRQLNRSWELVRRFRGRPGVDVFRLPVDFAQVEELVAGILSRAPRALLMVGESPIAELRVEQVALNVADAERADNAGHLPQSEAVVSGGVLALRTSWNARRLAGRLHQEGIPATVSFHAGTFVCNAALYSTLHQCLQAAAASRPAPAVGFLHVPNSRGPSGLGTTNLARAVELGIEDLLSLT
jgi:pyroglutamyl-peptidase